MTMITVIMVSNVNDHDNEHNDNDNDSNNTTRNTMIINNTMMV